MEITRIGLDLAKQVFHLYGAERQEEVICRRQLRRNKMEAFFRRLSPCLIGIEACASSHYRARLLQHMGYEVRLIAPQFVNPYVKGDKRVSRRYEGIYHPAIAHGLC